MTLEAANDIDARYLVPGLVRGLEILQTFTTERQQQTIADIARSIDVTRSTAFRLVYTLEALGFLQKVDDTRKYQLTSRVLDLGHTYLAGQDLIETANPILRALRDETQTSTHLAIREGRDVVYIARFAGNTRLVSSIGVGSRLPLHATTPGRVLLTGLSLPEIARLFEGHAFKSYTASTPTDVGALISQVEADRKEPSLVSWGYYEGEIAGISAPVYGQDHQIVAAVTISCPINTFSRDEFEMIIRRRVETAAMELSRALGYRP